MPTFREWFQFPNVLVPFVLLVCLGCPSYIAYTTYTDKRDKPAMIAAVSSYLDRLRAGDPQGAYEWICGREKRDFPLERWLSTRSFPAIEGYRILEAKIERSSRGPTNYSVEADVTYAAGRMVPMHYALSDEEAGWRICYETAVER